MLSMERCCDCNSEAETKQLVLVNFLRLPIKLWNDKFLEAIGDILG